MVHFERGILRIIVSCFVFLPASLVLASGPPDSALNPRNGAIETTDSSWAASNFNVRHVIHPGQGQSPIVFDVSTHQADDPDPRLTISPSGDTWVTWRRNVATSQVLIRKRTFSTGTWSEEQVVSASGESGTRPRIVHDGTNPWVVYLAPATGGTAVETARIIDDGPDPFGRVVVATTSYTGDLDVQIDAEAGHLWVSWIDSDSDVGWCQYDYGTSTWSSPSYESYVDDSVSEARSRISAMVLAE
jgi:hypothetical protein